MRATFPIIVTPCCIGQVAVQTVDARELHAFLEVRSQFKDWIGRRIEQYDFREGEDFCSFLSESDGGRPSREYALGLSMAKELAMVEKGVKGREARRYFLECERRTKAGVSTAPPGLATMEQRLSRLEHRLDEEKPKALALDRLSDQRGAVCLTEAAKLLGQKPRLFPRFLIDLRWLYRSGEHGGLQSFQHRIDKGLLVHRIVHIHHANDFTSLRAQPLITPKGLVELARILDSLVSQRDASTR